MVPDGFPSSAVGTVPFASEWKSTHSRERYNTLLPWMRGYIEDMHVHMYVVVAGSASAYFPSGEGIPSEMIPIKPCCGREGGKGGLQDP